MQIDFPHRSTVLRLAAVTAVVFRLAFPAPSAAEPFRFPEGKHGKGELRYIHGLPVLALAGTPEEMGQQHAVLVGDSLRDVADLPKQLIERHRVSVAWPLVVATARRLMKNAPQWHRRELDAAIEKSGLDEDVILVANGMLELRRIGGCSAFMIDGSRSATGGPLFGRNFDFPPLGNLDEYSLVMVYRPDGKRPFLSVGFPSLGGVVSGMNDKGLAVATLDVYSANDGSPFIDLGGTPLTFCFRRLLEECTTVNEAERLMRTMKPTTWMNLAVCDRKHAAVFEITPKNIIVRRGDKGRLACTNHFRSEKLARSKFCLRYAALASQNGDRKLSVAGVGKIMHKVNQGNWTMQTMVFEPARLRLHLSIGSGPTSARPLTTLEVSKLLLNEK